jgi:ribonuclease-3
MTLADLQKTLRITFEDKDLLKTAFVHRSHLNEEKNLRVSNERLEFLGDAVLSFLTSHFLYTTYPQYPEGILTNIRSSLVKTQSLSEVAVELHLGELLLLSKGEEESGGRKNPSLLADVFEALLGAVFLDQGIAAVKKLLSTYLFPKTKQIVEEKRYIDYKSLLQEMVQEQSKVSPTYQVLRSEGPDHDKTFWVAAMVADQVVGEGKGKSKQQAEAEAAANALEKYTHT